MNKKRLAPLVAASLFLFGIIIQFHSKEFINIETEQSNELFEYIQPKRKACFMNWFIHETVKWVYE